MHWKLTHLLHTAFSWFRFFRFSQITLLQAILPEVADEVARSLLGRHDGDLLQTLRDAQAGNTDTSQGSVWLTLTLALFYLFFIFLFGEGGEVAATNM